MFWKMRLDDDLNKKHNSIKTVATTIRASHITIMQNLHWKLIDKMQQQLKF